MKKHLIFKVALTFAIQSSFASAYPQPDHSDVRLPQTTCKAESVPADVVAGSWVADNNERIQEIQVEINGLGNDKNMLAADGMTLIPIYIRLLDSCGQKVKGKVLAKVVVEGAQFEPTHVSGVGPEPHAAIGILGAKNIEIVDGVATIRIISPVVSTNVQLTVYAGSKVVSGTIPFAPDPRPLIAAGLIDGIFTLNKRNNSVLPAVGASGGFEAELKRFQKEFDSGNISLSGRTAFFVKGMIQGSTLLTAAFDSEKESRQRLLKDINPEKFYPVLGDSSTKGIEARSSDRLYVRLDNGRNYALYGDFLSAEGTGVGRGIGQLQTRNLGLYNRTMTGLRGHLEDEKGFLDAFAMRDSLSQVVEEYRGNGTSGPYSVAQLNAVENTEILEVIVRDRNNSSRIVSSTQLVRFVDYTFEPFSGRILLNSPLPSLDDSLNPISLRITYEVDSGGEPFWVYGFTGQKKLIDKVEIGGSYIRDENPARPAGVGYTTVPGQGSRELRELVSSNTSVQLGDNGKLVIEAAKSRSATINEDVLGSALRVELANYGLWDSPWGTGLKWSARAYLGESEKGFHNPASSYTDGRGELGLKAVVSLSEMTRLFVDGRHTEDKLTDTYRDGAALRIERKLDAKWKLGGGIRHIQQSAGAVTSFSTASSNVVLPGQSSVYGGEGLNPAGAGFWGSNIGLNPITGQPQSMLTGQLIPNSQTSSAIDAWTVQTGATYQYNDKLSVGAEIGHDYGFDGDPYWTAVIGNYRSKKWRFFGRGEIPTGRVTAGGDYSITDNVSLYGRYESSNGLASGYALDSGAESSALVFGLRQSNNRGLENFNETRLRESTNGRETENATGMRNTFQIQPGLKANLAAEYLNVVSGGGRSATALAGGLERNESTWRATARLEWRRLERSPSSIEDDGANSWMSTLGLAKKLDTQWTGLFRNYLLLTDRSNLTGSQVQNRFQLGMAYRPLNSTDFDALMTYENKYENNPEIVPAEKRIANVLALSMNLHPSRPWWYLGRAAAKTVDEDLMGVRSRYQAWLVSGRVVLDLPKNFDLGAMFSVMGSPQGSSRQYAYGLEGGYLVGNNVWVSVGYNFAGFNDRDLTGSDYTSKGAYLRLRIKFDENSIRKVTTGFAQLP